MASVYRPTYLSAIPDNVVRCKLKGAPAVRYVDGKGKTHTRLIKLDKDGAHTGKIVCEQSTWWMRYTLPDGSVRREKGFKDKVATEQEAARREREAEQSAAGLQIIDSQLLSAPIQEHIDAYQDSLERAGRAPSYYALAHTRLERIATGCGWQTLRQITPAAMERYLTTLSSTAKPKTVNEYLAAAKSFVRWCINTRRLAGNPLESVQKTAYIRENTKAALTHAQAEKLLKTATKYRLLYFLALRTGLRRSELKNLQWGDIRLGVQGPYIKLRASATKAKRGDTLPLKQDIADELAQARPTDALPTSNVFSALPKMDTFRGDLDRAGIPRSDEWGKKVQFHSLRVTFGTWMAQAGVAPRVHMELMRHTDIKLTMKFYTDPRLLDTAGAIADLPDLRPAGNAESNRTVALKTGTDDMPVTNDGSDTIALNRVSECPEGSSRVHLGGSARKKTPIKQGFSMEGNAGTRNTHRDGRKTVKLGALTGRFRVSTGDRDALAPVTSGVGTAVSPACHSFISRTRTGDNQLHFTPTPGLENWNMHLPSNTIVLVDGGCLGLLLSCIKLFVNKVPIQVSSALTDAANHRSHSRTRQSTDAAEPGADGCATARAGDEDTGAGHLARKLLIADTAESVFINGYASPQRLCHDCSR